MAMLFVLPLEALWAKTIVVVGTIVIVHFWTADIGYPTFPAGNTSFFFFLCQRHFLLSAGSGRKERKNKERRAGDHLRKDTGLLKLDYPLRHGAGACAPIKCTVSY